MTEKTYADYNVHISDFSVQYNLADGEWKVASTFIVSEPLGSNEIYDREISVITEAELTADNIRRINCTHNCYIISAC